MQNIAVYPETPRRWAIVPLDPLDVPGGELELRYRGRAEYAGELFDQKTMNIRGRD